MTSHAFLEALHGHALGEGHQFCVWESSAKSSKFFTSTEDAAKYAQTLSARKIDTYVTVGGVQTPPSRGRGKLDDISYIVGMWADIDIAGPTHEDSKKSLPPSMAEALRIVRAIGPKPTILVESGGGLHAWWLFNEPWIFASASDKDRAMRLCALWNNTVRAVAQAYGYDADPTKDITRVLRIPGTVNTKCGKAVEVQEWDYTATYEPNDFYEYCIAEEFAPASITGAKAMAEVSGIFIDQHKGVPQVVLNLINGDDKFARTWERKRKDLTDQSASSYDLAIANEGVYRKWSDQEVADAIIAWRQKHNERPEKACRRDYLSRTLGKAKLAYAGAQALDALNQEMPPPGVELNADDRAKGLEHLSLKFGRKILKWQKVTSDPPLYLLTFGDPEVTVNMGKAMDVLNFGTVRARCYEHDVHLPEVLRKSWDHVLVWLLRLVEEVEDREGTIYGQVSTWLEGYLRTLVDRGDDWHDAIPRLQPFLHGGYLWIHASEFAQYVSTQHERSTAQTVRQMLRACGFEPALAQRPKYVKSRNYWRIQEDRVQEVLPND